MSANDAQKRRHCQLETTTVFYLTVQLWLDTSILLCGSNKMLINYRACNLQYQCFFIGSLNNIAHGPNINIILWVSALKLEIFSYP